MTRAFGNRHSIQLSYGRVKAVALTRGAGVARRREKWPARIPAKAGSGYTPAPQQQPHSHIAIREFYVEHKNHDQVFFVNFGKVMGGLFIIFFICIAAARLIDTGEGHGDDTGLQRLEARIKPNGTVVTDPAVLVAMASQNKVAREPYTGEQVVTKVCAACHDAGVLNAPKSNDKGAWAARKAAAGLDGLVKHAIEGKGSMPPRGGDSDLSDDEVKAAVEAMLKQAGV